MIERVKRYKWYLIIAAVVLGLVFLQVRKARLPPEVETADACVGSLALRIAASGLVESAGADLSFQGSGRIVAVYAREGERVARSKLLARLSPIGAAAAGLDGSDVIQAPYDGTVVDVYLREGAVVAPGQAVMRVVSDGMPWVTAFINSEDAAHISKGDTFRCRGGGYLSESWDMTVQEVGKEAVVRKDLPGSSRQVRVRFELDDPAFALPAGADVDVDGEAMLAQDAILVPTPAVIHKGLHNWVWLVEGERVSKREVSLGPNNFDQIEIRSGVEPGDAVVIHGKEGLVDGGRVSVRQAKPTGDDAEGGA